MCKSDRAVNILLDCLFQISFQESDVRGDFKLNIINNTSCVVLVIKVTQRAILHQISTTLRAPGSPHLLEHARS